MLLLSRKDINAVYSMRDAVEADKKAFRMAAEGTCEMPLRTNIFNKEEEGTFIFMPAYAKSLGAAGIKIVNVFPKNHEKNLPVTTAQMILIDGDTGIVKAILDGTYVTQMRTGAASGAAMDVLARKDCTTGALIGTGGQARTQAWAMMTVRPLKTLKVFDIDRGRREQFTKEIREEFASLGTKIVAVESSEEAVREADLVVTDTASHQPVFDAKYIKKGATVSCVGSFRPEMEEMDPALLQRASKVYFDLEDAVLAESGDIITPLKKGIITKDKFTGNLGDVISGKLKGRENDDEIIVFETVGVAAQDLVTAEEIYRKAIEKNVGTVWN